MPIIQDEINATRALHKAVSEPIAAFVQTMRNAGFSMSEIDDALAATLNEARSQHVDYSK